MFKRAQISIFIIISVILVGSTIFLYSQYSNSKEKELEYGSDEAENERFLVKKNIDYCIQQISDEAIYVIGFSGGNYNSNITMMDLDYPITYFVYEHKVVKPDQKHIENQISFYIEDNLENCTKKLSNNEYTFEFGEIKTTTQSNFENIVINVNMQTNVFKNNSEDKLTFKSYTYISQVPLGNILEFSEKIVDSELNNNYDYLEYIIEDYIVLVSPYDSENKIYTIYKNNTFKYETPFTFNFAIYDKINMPPKLEFIPDFVLNLNEEFSYNLTATDIDSDELEFYSKGQLLKVDNKLGNISFTPSNVIDYSYDVCVKDTSENEDCKQILFMVVNEK